MASWLFREPVRLAQNPEQQNQPEDRTCTALRATATAKPGPVVSSTSFWAVSPSTKLLPHCGPQNARFVVHIALRSVHRMVTIRESEKVEFLLCRGRVVTFFKRLEVVTKRGRSVILRVESY